MTYLLTVLRYLGNYLYRAKRLWELLSSRHFDRSCLPIDKAGPLAVGEGNFALVSQLRHIDVAQYLVAVRSFVACALSPAQIHIINDGSLTPDDLDRLKRHIPHVNMVDIADIDTGDCPNGGTWERLKYIIDLSQEIYAIQMDADIFCRQSIEAVKQAIEQNRPFLLGTHMEGNDSGRKVIPLAEASDFADQNQQRHVQNQVERQLRHLNLPEQKYIRGCSGFAGFARQCVSWQTARNFSREMESLLKSDFCSWTTWGTEQVTSNFVLANAPSVLVLTVPEYINHDGSPLSDHVRLIHFLGFARFENDTYRTLATKFIAEIV